MRPAHLPLIVFLVLPGCGGATAAEQHTVAPTKDPPTLTAKQGCARTPGAHAAPKVGVTLGDGPAYPVLGMAAAPPSPRGVAPLQDDTRRRGFYYHKTLWAIRPHSASAITVSGRQVGGTQPVKFFDGRHVHNRMRLPRSGRHWLYAPTTTLLPRPGCYSLRMRGKHLDQTVIFQATLLK